MAASQGMTLRQAVLALNRHIEKSRGGRVRRGDPVFQSRREAALQVKGRDGALYDGSRPIFAGGRI